jgi:hypothetical protein
MVDISSIDEVLFMIRYTSTYGNKKHPLMKIASQERLF